MMVKLMCYAIFLFFFVAAEMFAKSLRRQTTLVQLAKVGMTYSIDAVT